MCAAGRIELVDLEFSSRVESNVNGATVTVAAVRGIDDRLCASGWLQQHEKMFGT